MIWSGLVNAEPTQKGRGQKGARTKNQPVKTEPCPAQKGRHATQKCNMLLGKVAKRPKKVT